MWRCLIPFTNNDCRIVGRYARNRAAELLPRAVGLGGDTDTVASLADAVVGGLYGEKAALLYDNLTEEETGQDPAATAAVSLREEAATASKEVAVEVTRNKSPGRWLPAGLVAGLEDGERGKSYALKLAEQLASLDISFE